MAKKNKTAKRRPRRVGFPPRFFSRMEEFKRLRQSPRIIRGEGITLKCEVKVFLTFEFEEADVMFPVCEFMMGGISLLRLARFASFDPRIHFASVFVTLGLFHDSRLAFNGNLCLESVAEPLLNDEAQVFLKRDGTPKAPLVDVTIICRSYRSATSVSAKRLKDILTVKW